MSLSSWNKPWRSRPATVGPILVGFCVGGAVGATLKSFDVELWGIDGELLLGGLIIGGVCVLALVIHLRNARKPRTGGSSNEEVIMEPPKGEIE